MEKYYTKTHEWVSFPSADSAVIGVTNYLIQKQKNPSFINLCDEGDYLNAGDNAGDIEFTKGVFDIHAPVAGEVLRVNDTLLQQPKTLTGDTWILELTDIQKNRKLLTAVEYEDFLRLKGERNG